MTPEEVLNNLFTIYHEQKFAHAYLFETNDLDHALQDLKCLVKRISCPKKYQDNCTLCNLCNLIDNNNLPSLLIINPEGNSIKKDQIELIKKTFVNKPFYTKNNIYIMVEPELMNETSYNKMLKFIEEPESDIIGFFLTKNKDKLPPTIISRLEVIKLRYASFNEDEFISDEENAKINKVLNDYLDEINHGIDNILCYNTNVILKELTDKTSIIVFYKRMLSYFEKQYRDRHELIKKRICQLIIAYLEKLNYNVNISLLLDSFAIEMEQLYEK